MSNIAEGFGRGGNRELVQFMYISKRSLAEARSILYVARDQNYIDERLLSLQMLRRKKSTAYSHPS